MIPQAGTRIALEEIGLLFICLAIVVTSLVEGRAITFIVHEFLLGMSFSYRLCVIMLLLFDSFLF